MTVLRAVLRLNMRVGYDGLQGVIYGQVLAFNKAADEITITPDKGCYMGDAPFTTRLHHCAPPENFKTGYRMTWTPVTWDTSEISS